MPDRGPALRGCQGSAGRLTSARSRGGAFLVGEWMEHIDRIANVETLTLPGWRRGPWVHRRCRLLVVRPYRSDRIGRRSRRTRHLGHDPTIRAAKFQLAIGHALDAIALFVDGAMMTPAEQHEIRQRRRAAVGPVTDVMRLAEAPVAAREATTAVAIEERASAAPAGSCASWRRRRRCARRHRAPSRLDSRRSRGAGTFLRKRAHRLRRPTGRAAPDRSGPRRRRARPPGSARPASPDRSRGAARSRRGAAARPPAAEPSSAFPRRGPGAARRTCWPAAASTGLRVPPSAPSGGARRPRGTGARGSSWCRRHSDTRGALGWRAAGGPRPSPPCDPCDASHGRCARRAPPCRRGRWRATAPRCLASPRG